MKPLMILFLLFSPLFMNAQSIDYDAVADRIVNQSLELKPGEVVAIYADLGDQEIVEALYVAICKAGGQPLLRFSLPDAEVRVAREVDIQYLKQPYWASAVIGRLTDCVISVRSVDDPERWNDLDPDVLNAFRESSDKTRMVRAHDRVRVVSVGQTDGIPTKALADLYGADYMSMQNSFWNAMRVDHATLQKTGHAVLSKLNPGSQCAVTSPHGTNITFRLADSDPMMSCGKTTDQTSANSTYAWLPAGDAYTAVDPASANGVIVMPVYYDNSKKITNLKITFKHGVIQNVTADQNTDDIKTRILGKGAAAVPLSAVDLGLNPERKIIGDYRSFEMSGMVTLCVGDNDWAGGSLNNGIEYSFHLVDATFTVGGKAIVKAGQLQ